MLLINFLRLAAPFHILIKGKKYNSGTGAIQFSLISQLKLYEMWYVDMTLVKNKFVTKTDLMWIKLNRWSFCRKYFNIPLRV